MLLAGAVSAAAANVPVPPPDTPAMMKGTQTAVLSGGCFWGMQGVFERLKGVVDVQAGYSGGEASTAHYEMVGSGSTGHAESIQVHFDPTKVSYGTLLKVFFIIAHDPTQFNYQGPDHGTQYRSAIWYANEGQKQVAERYIQDLDKAGLFRGRIVTEVQPLKAFYAAEDYHQQFLDNNPTWPYIVAFDLKKIADLKNKYPELVGESAAMKRIDDQYVTQD